MLFFLCFTLFLGRFFMDFTLFSTFLPVFAGFRCLFPDESCEDLGVMALTCLLSSSAYLLRSLTFMSISVRVSPILRLCFHLHRLCALVFTSLPLPELRYSSSFSLFSGFDLYFLTDFLTVSFRFSGSLYGVIPTPRKMNGVYHYKGASCHF